VIPNESTPIQMIGTALYPQKKPDFWDYLETTDVLHLTVISLVVFNLILSLQIVSDVVSSSISLSLLS
jgi:hypothetical protein